MKQLEENEAFLKRELKENRNNFFEYDIEHINWLESVLDLVQEVIKHKKVKK